MKNRTLKKLIATLMLCLTVIAAFPIAKTNAMDKEVYRSKFWAYMNQNNLVPSSDGATNMLYAARATVGLTGKQLGSKGDWCCSHISCLAIVTKQEKAIPYSKNVKDLYDGILKVGGTIVYSYKGKGSFASAKPGDILIVRKGGSDFSHAELVSKTPSKTNITSIGGNTGNSNHAKAKVQERSCWSKNNISYIIRPAYKANSLSYLDRCSRTDTAITVKATDNKNYIMSMPCSSGTDASSKAVRKMIQGETFKATAILKNSAGNYWYKVTADRDGITGYIFGGSATYIGVTKDAVRGNVSLATTTPKKGKAVTIGGTLSSNVTIVSVKGTLKGTGSTQTASASVNAKAFNLKGSKIDNNLRFGKLGSGAGTIYLDVVLQLAYIKNNKIVNANQTIILPEIKFTVK